MRACDPAAAEMMVKRVEETARRCDSIGGIIECRVMGVPAGLGEPVFDKLDADLAKAILSIRATKGIEFGTGFAAADMIGSQHNDPMTPEGFLTNNAGGILGGISTGQEIVFRTVIKPTSSIAREQQTIDTARRTGDHPHRRPSRPVHLPADRAGGRGHGRPGAGRSLQEAGSSEA